MTPKGLPRQLSPPCHLPELLQQLPAAQGRIFLMREWLELPTDEICNRLSISATNAGVLLHRARLRLRECLNLNWFDDQSR